MINNTLGGSQAFGFQTAGSHGGEKGSLKMKLANLEVSRNRGILVKSIIEILNLMISNGIQSYCLHITLFYFMSIYCV